MCIRDSLLRLVGLPSFPTGCRVDADMAKVASGDEVDLILSARINQDDRVLTISHLPPGSSAEEVEEAIYRLLLRPGEGTTSSQRVQEPLPIRALYNESAKRQTRIVVNLGPSGDSAAIIAHIEQLQPVRKTTRVRFERPLVDLLREAAADRKGLEERLAITVPAARP